MDGNLVGNNKLNTINFLFDCQNNNSELEITIQPKIMLKIHPLIIGRSLSFLVSPTLYGRLVFIVRRLTISPRTRKIMVAYVLSPLKLFRTKRMVIVLLLPLLLFRLIRQYLMLGGCQQVTVITTEATIYFSKTLSQDRIDKIFTTHKAFLFRHPPFSVLLQSLKGKIDSSLYKISMK